MGVVVLYIWSYPARLGSKESEREIDAAGFATRFEIRDSLGSTRIRTIRHPNPDARCRKYCTVTGYSDTRPSVWTDRPDSTEHHFALSLPFRFLLALTSPAILCTRINYNRPLLSFSFIFSP